jgi:hypothetical protein
MDTRRDLNPGELLQVKYEFDLLCAEPGFWKWSKVHPGYLFTVGPMDMTREWPMRSGRRMSVRRARPFAISCGPRMAIRTTDAAKEKAYNEAKQEFKGTGKIRGYKFLCPDGKNYIWLSYYTVKLLEEING